MKNNKQAAFALVIGLFALSFAGCGGATGKATPPAAPSAPAGPVPKRRRRCDAFNALLAKKGVRAAELLAAVDAGIGKVTRNGARRR
jgi:hypothetical protein